MALYPTQLSPYTRTLTVCRMVEQYIESGGTFQGAIEALDNYQHVAADAITNTLACYPPESDVWIALAVAYNEGIKQLRWFRGRLDALTRGVPLPPVTWTAEQN